MSDNLDLAKSIAYYLDNCLEFQSTGKDPKNNGFAFAKVPDWQLKQWGAAALALARPDGQSPETSQ